MKKIGKILPPKTLMLRFEVGCAGQKGGATYELSIDAGSSPLVRSETTGKWFWLSWKEIIELAKQCGIDEP